MEKRVILYRGISQPLNKMGVPKVICDYYFLISVVLVVMFNNFYLIPILIIIFVLIQKMNMNDKRFIETLLVSTVKRYYTY